MLLQQIPLPPESAGFNPLLLASICGILLAGFVYALKRIDKIYADQLAESRAKEAKRDLNDQTERAAMAAKWDAAEAKRDASRDRLFQELRDSTAEITEHYDGEIGRLRLEIEAQGKKVEDAVSRIGRLEKSNHKTQ